MNRAARCRIAMSSGLERSKSFAPGIIPADLPKDHDFVDIHCDRCGKQLTQGWSGQEHWGCGGRFLIYGDIRKPRSAP